MKSDIRFDQDNIVMEGDNLQATFDGDITLAADRTYVQGREFTVQPGTVNIANVDGTRQYQLAIGPEGFNIRGQSVTITGKPNNDKFSVRISQDGTTLLNMRRVVVLDPDLKTGIDGRVALAQSAKNELVLNQDMNYKGGVRVDGDLTVTGLINSQGNQGNVSQEITALKATVESQAQRIAILEKFAVEVAKKLRLPIP